MKTETFENDDVKSVTCHRLQSKSEHLSKMADGLVMLTHAQSQISVVFIVFEHFSVDRRKRYENASVDENILLRFRRDESGDLGSTTDNFLLLSNKLP